MRSAFARIALSIATLLCAASAAHAQGTATIVGRVTNAATGQPLADVKVFALSSMVSSTGTTDASGNYSMSVSVSVTYTLRTSNQQQFVNQTYGGEPCAAQGCVPGRSFTLAPGQTLQADFALEPGVRISGRITDAATGAPLRLNVSLFDAQHRSITAALPDTNGVYSFSAVPAGGLPAGTYFTAAFSSRFEGYVSQIYAGISCVIDCRLQDATPIRVAARQTAGGIDFALQPLRGVITGRVTNAATGQPIIGVQVHAEARAAAFTLFSATTNAAGEFRIENLIPATYSVYANTSAAPGFVAEIFSDIPNTCASNAFASGCRVEIRTGTPVTVAAGQTVSGIDFALNAGGSVRGTVTRGGQPLPGTEGARVTLFDAMGRQAGLGLPTGNGAYAIDGLPPGTYFALGGAGSFPHERVYGSAACRLASCVTSGTPIVVGTAPVTAIDFNLSARTGEISGHVRSAADGLPLVATVFLTVGDELFPRQTTTTAAEGFYRFDQLAADAYRIRVEAAGYVAEWFANACAPCGDRGTAIVVAEGASVGGVGFALDPAGQIKGQLSVTNGTLASSIVVEALRADGSVVGTASSANQYTIDGLPAGSYFVRARSTVLTIKGFSSGGEYPPQLYNQVPCDSVECPFNGATPVTVTAGAATTGIDFAFERGGTITGRVVGEGFRTLGDQIPPRPATFSPSVRAYTSDGREAGLRVPPVAFTSDTYEVRGLRAGTYYLTAAAPGYPTTIYKDLVCPACPPQRGTPVTVTAGQTRSGINFLVLPGGSIAGTVRDAATGDPIAGVTVTAYTGAGATNVQLTLIGTATTSTDRLGRFLLENLGAGDYFIATSNPLGYADEVYDNVACGTCDPARGRAVSVQGGVTTGGIDITLARGALVSGLATDANGGVVPQVPVALFDSAGAPVARVTTSFDGVFTASVPVGNTFARAEPSSPLAWRLYDNLPCPNGACDPRDGTPIAASAGARIQGINFTLPACGVTLIETMRLPNGAVGAGYSATITATGAGPYTFRVIAGTLPPGVSLASNGALSGTPSAQGRYSFTVGAANGAGCGTTRVFTIDVTACTPVLTATTADIAGTGGTIAASVSAACAPAISINAPWITRGATVAGDPTSYEFTIAPNPGGRRTGSITFGNRAFTINQAGAASQVPFGTVDTPPDGMVATGSISVSGWVLDDLRVTKVEIFRAPSEGAGPLIFLGTAVLVPGARPDVEALFGDLPYVNRAGWGYLLLTNMLPNQGNGVFTLHAIAEDAEGNRVQLGTRTVVANNAAATRPFGAIDTPAQGETIRGTAYVNYGWALTPQPKTIPTDGSTIRVLIDGVDVGSVNYNHFRADVAGLFPGLNNSSGPVGFRTIDTTALADGLHTISWIVTDNAGSAEGIGSRYFTVANGTAQLLAEPVTPPLASQSLPGVRQIRLRQLENVSIELGSEAAACAAVFTGRENVRGELRDLPVGSTLDAATGRFTWQPGPGFLGTYRLAFFVSDCAGVRRVDLDIVIEASR